MTFWIWEWKTRNPFLIQIYFILFPSIPFLDKKTINYFTNVIFQKRKANDLEFTKCCECLRLLLPQCLRSRVLQLGSAALSDRRKPSRSRLQLQQALPILVDHFQRARSFCCPCSARCSFSSIWESMGLLSVPTSPMSTALLQLNQPTH